MVTIDPASAAAEPLSNLPPLQIKDEQWAFWALPADQRFFAYQDRTGLRIWDRRRGGALIVREGLARHGESSFHFSWDGKTLFYSTFDGHYTKLYRQSLDPWRPASPLNDGRPLSGPILQVGAPSPDSEVVSFRTGQGGTAESYLIDARRGPAHLLLPPGGVGPVVSWSPDGARFVYTIYRGDEAAGAAVAEVTR